MLRRLKPFDVQLHYTDRHRLPPEVEKELGVTFHETAADMVPHCDVVTINAPLHPETENLFDDGDDREDEARRLSREHRARQDLRSRRGRRARSKAASSRAMPATSGSRSPRRTTIRGGRCRITA